MTQLSWNILMVDDDEDDYFLTRQMLSEAKYGRYILDWASTYEDGWEKIQAGDYDAVLMDYDLGPQNGLDLIRKAVNNHCRFPIILFTGRGSYEVDLQAMQSGAALYLTKSEVNPLLLERGIRYAIERKQTEQALSKANTLLSEQKQELDRRLQERSHILESIQDSFFSIDRNWLIIYINRKAARNEGREPEEIIGKNFWDVFPKVNGTKIEHYYRRAMVERIPIQFETLGFYQDAVYNVNIYPSEEGISVFAQDISERKRAEQALEHSRQEQARLASFPELNPNPILEIDLSGKIHYINPHAHALFPDLTEKETEHAYLAGWEEIVSRVSKEPLINRVREIQVEDQFYQQSIFFYEEHQLIRIYGMDISKRIRALHALRESERQQRELAQSLAVDRSKLAAVLANLPVGVWIADETGRIIDKNGQADRIWAGNAPLAENFEQYHQYIAWEAESGKTPLPDEFPMAITQQTGQPVGPVEYNIRRFDGTEGTILVSAAPIKDGNGAVTGTVGINVDITERKRAEAELERYTRQLEQSNRELHDFAFVASHDMQEPLRKILTFAERLQQKASGKLDLEERDYIARMINAAERMASMLHGLLEYSRVTTSAQPYMSVNLAHVAAEVLQDLELQIEDNKGQVEVGELPVIEAEPIQLRQLLQNLISNALKFSRPGIPPQVKVTSRLLEHPEPGQPQLVEIQVEDNGIGIDPKSAGELFQPYHRLVGRSQYAGSGMGLAICRKIVERHGGAITAKARLGQGAIFIVRLPIRQPGV